MAELVSLKLIGPELPGALPAFFDHADGDGIEDEGAMAVPFGALDPTDGGSVRGGVELAAGDAAKIVGDDVVIADALTLAMNAVEEFYKFDGLDVEAGFFAHFANNARGEGLTDLEHATGEGPVAFEGFRAATNQEHASILDDDCADADEGRVREFAFEGSAHVRGVRFKGNSAARCACEGGGIAETRAMKENRPSGAKAHHQFSEWMPGDESPAYHPLLGANRSRGPIIKQTREGEKLAEFTLKIEGMHCGSCVRRVSQALAGTPGIVVKQVGLGAARLTSDEDPPPLGLAIAAIAKAGYTAYLESNIVDTASSSMD